MWVPYLGRDTWETSGNSALVFWPSEWPPGARHRMSFGLLSDPLK